MTRDALNGEQSLCVLMRVKKPPRDARQQNTRPLVRETGCDVDGNALAVWCG